MGVVNLSEVKAEKAYKEYYGNNIPLQKTVNIKAALKNLHKEYVQAWIKLINS